MSKERVLFILVPEYADWEVALLAAGLRTGFGMLAKGYDVGIVAPALKPVLSMGGFRVLPDYSFDTAPDEFSALFLVGGTNWFGDEAKGALPLVRKAVARQTVLGGICDASAFLAAHGVLDNVEHTGNSLDSLKAKAGNGYGGEALYRHLPSVRDGNIVTAGGTGFMEFACNAFRALEAAPAETIDEMYRIMKAGMFEG